ncbi:DUF748 domain-containing protein [Holophaga foetida]|uniref:DUF748 domain-containing protein n=1 Tax=Holophaga foetida TaxID=35839 RepID=UPI0002471C81|nr:DUF748 domain-containing protein [Holophaga foetida]
MSLQRWLSLPRWTRRLSIAVVAVLVLYALLGFLLLPFLVKRELPPRLSTALKREVTLRKVKANPFALSLTLEGLEVKDRDGLAFFGWERLYVNLKLRSVLGNPAFDDIDILKPHGRVVIGKDGKLNFADLLETPQGKAPEAASAKPLDLAIEHLKVEGARFSFEDRSLAQPFATTLGPVGLELKQFRTVHDNRNPYAFQGQTGDGERFAWDGSFSLNPLRSQGRFVLENLDLPHYTPYFADRVAFDLKGGRADLQAYYTLAWSEAKQEVKIDKGAFNLRDLQIGERGAKAASLALPLLELRGAQADLMASTAEVDSVLLRGIKVQALRLPNGQIDLVNLLTPKPAKTEEPSKPFQFRLKELGVEGLQASFEDRVPKRPVKVEVADLSLKLKDFTLEPDHASQLSLALKLTDQGSLQAEGELKPLKTSVDLTLKGDRFELSPYDPYLEPSLQMRLVKGRLGFDGRVKGSFIGKPSDSISYQGNVSVDDLETADAERRETFYRHRSLRLSGLEFVSNPLSIKARGLDLRGPQVLLVVAADGRSNLDRAMGAPAAPPAPSPARATAAAPAPRILLAKVTLGGGRFSLLDRSLQPNAVLSITDLEGTYVGLSTEPNTASTVDFRGKVGGVGPMTLQGRAMPLRHDKDTNLKLIINNTEMTDGSPYSGKFLGYTIRKGKLEVDTQVSIQQRKLDMLAKVKMDQFFLGDKVESPDAVHLPVKLALAILRDRHGLINLELPVDGNLDDPDFHYGKIVWRAIVNIFTKLATSPFKALGGLFGGGDKDLSFAEFEAGSATPTPDSQKKVEILIKALHERPDLNLELEGVANPAADGDALRREALEARLRQVKLKALREKNPSQEEQPVAPDEREKWLKAAFLAAFPPAKDSKAKAPEPAEMEQRLAATLTVDPGRYVQLANQRAKATLALLLAGAQVEPGRLFEVRGGERAQKEGGSRVYFGLK